MIDAFGIERSEVSKAISPNQLKALSNIAGTEGAAAKYARGRLAANTAGKEAAKARKFAVDSTGQATRVSNAKPSAVGRVQRESSRAALSTVAREPRAGSVGSTETAAAEAIRNNRTRSQKVLQAVGSGSRAVGTRVRAAGSRVGSGTARAGRAVGSGTVRATRAVGSGTVRAGRSLRASMTRTPKPAAVTPAAAPAAATGTEAGTTTVKNKSNFKRNAALVGGGAAIGAGGMAYSTNRNNQTMSKSAFGVDHEVSKFVAGGAAIKGIGAITKPAATLKPIAATKAAYQGARAANLNRSTSAGYAAGAFARKIPKTAVAVGAAGGAGIGYAAANRGNR